MIPERWYPVLEARRLRRRPVQVERFGARWVAWRGPDGTAVLLPGYCPHRGASLAAGRVVDGTLACPWHGFRFAPDGHCVLTPCEGADAVPRRALALEPAVVREAHGLIWCWWGAPHDSYPPVPWFEDVATEARRSWEASYELPYHYTRMVEAHLDVHHTPFVHRSSVPGVGTRVAGFEARLEGDRISTRGELRHEGRAQGIAFRDDLILPNLSMIELTGKLRLLVCATPMNDERCWVWFRYYQDYTDLPLLRSLLAGFATLLELVVVQPQDWRIYRGMRPGTVDQVPYHFVEADHGIALYRKRRQELLATPAADRSRDSAAAGPGGAG